MRISDWSSDVCSSDLHRHAQARAEARQQLRGQADLRHQHQRLPAARQAVGDRVQVDLGLAAAGDAVEQQRGEAVDVAQRRDRGGLLGVGFRARLRRWCELRCGDRDAFDQRSEEHTSELQSLMRISYAVFCLKKKKKKQLTHTKTEYE